MWFRNQTIQWHIEWYFDLTETKLTEDNVSDLIPLSQLLSSLVTKNDNIKQALKPYFEIPIEEWCLFLKKEGNPVRSLFLFFNCSLLIPALNFSFVLSISTSHSHSHVISNNEHQCELLLFSVIEFEDKSTKILSIANE
jgi:hypothetical protein